MIRGCPSNHKPYLILHPPVFQSPTLSRLPALMWPSMRRSTAPRLLRALATSPPQSNYFQLFGLSHRFDIDLPDLASRFKSLQRQWHPDRHASGSTGTTAKDAADMSALLNQAYSALQSPHTRAKHLLTVLGEDDERDIDPEFLAWVVEYREKIASAQPESTDAQAMRDMLRHVFDDCMTQLNQCFEGADFDTAAKLTDKLKYLSRMRVAVEELFD